MALISVLLPDGTMGEMECDVPVPVRDIAGECAAILASVFGQSRASLNSYALRIMATSNPTEEMIADLETFKALDLWEEAMLAERSKEDPAWPEPPPGGVELVQACS